MTETCRRTYRLARVVLAAVLAFALLSLAGCSSGGGEASSQASEQNEAQESLDNKEIETEEEPSLQIGTPNDASAQLEITNSTNTPIAGIACKQSGSEAYGDNLLSAGTTWLPEEEAMLYVPAIKAEASGVQQGETSEEDVNPVLRDQYDVLIAFADGAEATLHNVAFDGIEQAQLCFDAETSLAYLTYSVDGAQESTLENEVAYRENEQALAEEQARIEAEAAAAQAAAEAAAVEAQAQEAYQEPSYDYGYSYSTDSGSTGGSGYSDNTGSSGGSGNSGSSEPSQSDDQCVDGGVMLR